MPKNKPTSSQPGYKAPAIQKAFLLLRTVAETRQGLKIVELSERLGFSKSTTHGLVHALMREGALAKEPADRRFFLGPALADLAFTNWNLVKVNELAQPILNTIHNTVEETVFLGVRVRKRAMITAKAEATESLKISAPVGTTIPIFAGAVGKVFLAHDPRERIEELMGDRGLPAFTANSTVNIEDYFAELERVQRQGYAIDDEEYLTGIRAVAVAIDNKRGLPMAIWVVGISSNLGLKKIEKVVDITTAAAQTLRGKIDNTR